MKKFGVLGVSVVLALSLLCCNVNAQTCENQQISNGEQKKAVEVNNQESSFSYNTQQACKEKTIKSCKAANKLVHIDKKQSYYDVYLDFEKGSHYDVAYTYGEAIKEIYPDYSKTMEPYIYECINELMPEIKDDFSTIDKRVKEIMKTLDPEYLEEIKGLADSLVEDTVSFKKNEKLSKEEIYLLQLVPDVIRPTQCSGIAAYGNKSATGKTITLRILDWNMGSERQMGDTHAVIHFMNGDKSFTSYGVLGLFEVISASNPKGVFAGILDSGTGGEYICEGKKSYTYSLRYAIEHFSSAEEVGSYMNEHTNQFTFSHNILATDPNNAYVAEDCVDLTGKIALRKADSPLMKGLKWNNLDAIAVVNGYALEGNVDNTTGTDFNMGRWNDYNKRLSKYDKVTVGDMEDIVTKDDPNSEGWHIYSTYSYQMIVVDSANGTVDIAFAPRAERFPLKPKFIRVIDNLYEK